MDENGQTRPVALAFAATPEAVRQALAEARVALARAGLGPALLSRVEMVLAEVLNNIAEHAYVDARAQGCLRRVHLAARPCAGGVTVTVTDRGAPMPCGRLPGGALPEAGVPRDRLPEGGFGWYLIHSQTEALSYRRAGGANILELRFRPRGGGG